MLTIWLTSPTPVFTLTTTKMEGDLGIEPRTRGLRARCSTSELITQYLVRAVGLEPTLHTEADFKSAGSTYSPTPANYF